MERYIITSSQRATNGSYYWTRDTFDSACRVAKSAQDMFPNAIVCVLDVGCGTLENWQHWIKTQS